METPQISLMTAAWSPLTPSPFSVITYTCNRPTQAPKPVPSSVFLSCVCVSAVLVVLVGPSPWSLCSDLCGAAVVLPALHHTTTTIIPGATSTQYCTVLHCTVLCYTARCSYYPFIYTIRGLRLFVCGECIIRPSCWCLGYVQ